MTNHFNYKFVENGGYDCMTDAFFIYDDDIIVTIIDCGSFGQKHWTSDSKSRELAEKYAKLIVESINKND